MAEYKDYKASSTQAKTESSKEEKPAGKTINKVVKGSVKKQKKSAFRRIADDFIQADAKSVASYVLEDVIVPETKKIFQNSVNNALEMFLWKKTGSPRDRRKGNAEKVSYRSMYKGVENRRDYEERSSYSYDEIILDSKDEAQEVLDRMFELLEDYKMVSVADFYDLVGVTGKTTDNRYGWTDLDTASIVHLRDGWLIKLPRTVALD